MALALLRLEKKKKFYDVTPRLVIQMCSFYSVLVLLDVLLSRFFTIVGERDYLSLWSLLCAFSVAPGSVCAFLWTLFCSNVLKVGPFKVATKNNLPLRCPNNLLQPSRR